jgi:4-hydroxy-2-oxoheptanedioate aldolase
MAHFRDPHVYELISRMGFDGIWLDMEHHLTNEQRADELIRASRMGTSDVMARPGKGEFMRMARLLESGAAGIMYPRCADAAEAREVVRWAKFAPLGERGVDAANADNPYLMTPIDEYVRFANDQTFINIQLEDPEAVNNAEAIAAVEGVDFIFFGPGDFSVLNGHPGEIFHSQAQQAMQHVAEAAAKAGKRWGSTSAGPEHTQQLLDMGASMICQNADLVMLIDGLQAMQRQMADYGFTFNNEFNRKPDTNSEASADTEPTGPVTKQ